ncbi:MAG TPA: signal peptide peptidase SppA, partial [Xylella fastidiosa subsp. pauca]
MNQSVPRNPIARFFIGLWGAMNFTRRLILNLVFFGFLFFLLLMMLMGVTHGLKGKQLDDRTTLLIGPQGTLVEQFSADPVSRALAKATGDKSGQEVQLRDLIRVIEAAAKDKKVERVLLDLDKLQPSGYASLREVVAALQNLKGSGKQLVAFSESMTQSQ